MSSAYMSDKRMAEIESHFENDSTWDVEILLELLLSYKGLRNTLRALGFTKPEQVDRAEALLRAAWELIPDAPKDGPEREFMKGLNILLMELDAAKLKVTREDAGAKETG